MTSELVMNAGIRQKWLDALRSGEYKQGDGALAQKEYTEDGAHEPTGHLTYCCLGVLCDIVGLEARQGRGDDMSFGPNGDTGSLPWFVWRGVGLPTGNPYIPTGHLRDVESHTKNAITLAELNDSGMPFHQIADVIEYFIKPEES